ncbi:efflux RND transporter periplasmic adaptor subunit [Trueperella bialowiezensis]|uniref:Efflux transporter, RND family, MFP subunit n=1 Tax=Trueperella bialowiezensis TaxID=312285 RepID=A0A3S4VAX5_9ACTO|nr:efflux RND transporter periplasmic adaptor subunit [Trueperella bialowiezensis]VEI13504.1 efflux transporter, RND family, MFP subunit [Trueperella bialowiezensis]
MAHPRQSRFSQFMAVARLIVLAVIAIALVKFAFFPGEDEENNSLDPEFAIPQMTILPETTTITNTLELTGTIQPNPATDVPATSSGEVSTIFVDDGVWVDAGAPLLELRKEMPGDDVETQDEEGNVTITPGQSWYQYTQIKAPVAGRVKMNVLRGQTFNIGDPVAKLSPDTFSAHAQLTPELLYRLATVPDTATITIKDGPAPFECTGLKLDTGIDSQPKTAEETTEAGVRLTCTIPGEQRVFAGLAISMTVTGGEAADVLALPVSAVEGRYGTGYVYLPTDDPEAPEKHEVVLGLTDGAMIEIKEGLGPDQEVLEFTPINRDEMQCDPWTGEGCM